ncbi:MAG: lycopene cyclase domain-containing protein [Candidatus Omnitrophota bacterium]|jgi:lycopene cyclase domain-containing protein
MKEYTILAVISVITTVILDRTSKVGVLKKRVFYLFLAVILFFKLLVNGYLTASPIVIYDSDFFMGLRITTIPLEDFFFGFSMVATSIIFWEYFKRREA